MQKKYPLENLESLIHEDLAPGQVRRNPPSVVLIATYINRVSEQERHIRNTLLEEAYSLENEKSIEVLVQRYQSSLIGLADDIVQYTNIAEDLQLVFSDEDTTITIVYQYALKCIEELLTVIEKHFSRYFNIDEKIPDSYRTLMQTHFKEMPGNISSQSENMDVDVELIQLMNDPFYKFIKADNRKPITYRDLLYLKTLQKEFSEFFLPGKKTVNTDTTLGLLLYLNFNSYDFFTYYLQIMSKDVNEADSIGHQIEKLAWWLKTISQVQTKPEVAYKVNDQSAKEQLLSWIYDETAFLEKKKQLTLVFPSPGNNINNPSIKITTTLSVKQLALMMRLLFDNGIVKHENQTQLLTKVAEWIKTDKRENISPGNLRVKYYDIDQPTKNIIKDYLIQMINQLNKY